MYCLAYLKLFRHMLRNTVALVYSLLSYCNKILYVKFCKIQKKKKKKKTSEKWYHRKILWISKSLKINLMKNYDWITYDLVNLFFKPVINAYSQWMYLDAGVLVRWNMIVIIFWLNKKSSQWLKLKVVAKKNIKNVERRTFEISNLQEAIKEKSRMDDQIRADQITKLNHKMMS